MLHHGVKLLDGRGLSVDELRAKYIVFVTRLLGEDICPDRGGEQVTYDDRKITKLLTLYEDDSPLTDLKIQVSETPDGARREAMARVLETKRQISKVDPVFIALFDFYIHTLFYQRSPDSGGGSISSGLGVIWCSISKRWTHDDIHEFLLHELTHNLLFLTKGRTSTIRTSISSPIPGEWLSRQFWN